MKAKKVLKKLDYLPRWAWYTISFFAAGPVGPLGVHIAFHVLNKIASEQAEEEYSAAWERYNTHQDDDCTVTGEDDINERWAQTEASAARAGAKAHSEPKQEAPIFDENADAAEVLRTGHAAMKQIRLANDIIADEALSAQIDSIENSCAQILSILEQRPQLLSQLRSFLRYYLPTTLRLLDARAKLENNANTRKAREVRTRISEAVGAIDKAFLKQVEALDAYRFIDLESEMDVLRDMLKADGLIDEKEDDDPFAAVLGGR